MATDLYPPNRHQYDYAALQARQWAFTTNLKDGPVDGCMPLEVIERFEDLVAQGILKYFIFQLEVGNSGNVHYQGYVSLARSWYGKRVQQTLWPGLSPHLEAARGTPEQNKAYCSKADTQEDGPWEGGDISKCGQGTRTDFQALQKAIEGGTWSFWSMGQPPNLTQPPYPHRSHPASPLQGLLLSHGAL